MKLNIILPSYNEEAVIEEAIIQLTEVIQQALDNKEIDECDMLFVDDGSSDRTWSLIENYSKTSPYVHGLKLAHNVGHQNALWAGMEYSADKCDAIISIDADLQQDIHKISEMIEKYKEGYEIVYGVRNSRKTDSIFKRRTALTFYKLMGKMGVDIIPNHADYRLLGSKALKALISYPERNLFLRGLVRLIGFKSTEVYFDVQKRFAGESKYTLGKMLNFAIDGITSFSVQPLRIITNLGFICVIISIIEIIYIITSYCRGTVVPGWSSLIFSIWFIGGLLLISVGVLGEYIGKIYTEVKQRPRYIIEEEV